jgi:hypothetical protein
MGGADAEELREALQDLQEDLLQLAREIAILLNGEEDEGLIDPGDLGNDRG